MPRSPGSSEEERVSEYPEGESDSESSRDGPPGPSPGPLDRRTQGPPMSVPDDARFSMMVFRIGIPDLHQTKCLRFNPDAAIWLAKQQILCTLNESLKDVLNYGLFQPATNGRDAKFLDEERLLREYPQSFEKGVPYLEFRYKTRVYKQTNLDEKQLAKLHTKVPPLQSPSLPPISPVHISWVPGLGPDGTSSVVLPSGRPAPAGPVFNPKARNPTPQFLPTPPAPFRPLS